MNLQIVIRGKENNEGQVPIYLRYTANRKADYINLDFRVLPKSWDKTNNRYLRNHPQSGRLNKILYDILTRAEDIVLDMKREQLSSFEIFRKRFLKIEDVLQIVDFVDLADKYVHSPKLTDASKKVYNAAYLKLKKIYPIWDISTFGKKEAQEFLDRLLLTNLTINSAWFYFKIIKILWNKILDEENPFARIKPPKLSKPNPKFILEDELRLIIDLYDKIKAKPEIAAEILNCRTSTIYFFTESLRLYLFCCFTGLRFSDALELSNKHILCNNNSYSINKKAYKTRNTSGVFLFIPLLDDAVYLIDVKKEGLVFNIKYELYSQNLKKISTILNFKKSLTSHTARHTFGVRAANAGMRLETIQKIMGHTNPEMTKHYASLSNEALTEEFFKTHKNNSDA